MRLAYDVIGEGGMGVVFRAHHRDLDRPVAIKCIRREAFADQAAVVRFQREAHMLAALEHPGVVRVYTILDVDDMLLIVSELIAGQTLKQRLTIRHFRWRSAVRLMIEIARIVHFVHGQSIVHRDIKSDNVLLPKDGGVKLIDFGLAKNFVTLPEVPLLLADENLPWSMRREVYQATSSLLPFDQFGLFAGAGLIIGVGDL